MKRTVIALIVILCAVFSGCVGEKATLKIVDNAKQVFGSGNIADGKFTFDGDVTSIVVEGLLAEINITDEKSDTVIYTADDNIINYIDISVTDGVLRIGKSDDRGWSDTNAVFNIGIASDSLKEVKAGSMAKLQFDGAFNAGTFEIGLDGMASLEMDLTAESLIINADGMAGVTLTGEADKLDIICNGMSNVDTHGLEAQEAGVECNGMGSVRVYADKTLDIKVSGMSNVKYWGNAQSTISADKQSKAERGE